ncbi:DUF6327 family protein [Flavobacterium sp.]|uniref:DUF6327 family protein n=1 Tax=Flavobacterium sp. TaxID=239 RepID=UPI003526F542
MTKKYSSFAAIDKDLEILKLQKRIDERKLNLSFNQTVDAFTPTTILQKAISNSDSLLYGFGIVRKIVVPLLINKFFKKK